METMSTEELAEKIFEEFWTCMAPDYSSKRVKDRGEKVRRIKKLLGKGKFVQYDQNFWIVTEENLQHIKKVMMDVKEKEWKHAYGEALLALESMLREGEVRPVNASEEQNQDESRPDWPECQDCGDHIMESEEEVSVHRRCIEEEKTHRNPCKDNPSCPNEYREVGDNFSVCIECYLYLPEWFKRG